MPHVFNRGRKVSNKLKSQQLVPTRVHDVPFGVDFGFKREERESARARRETDRERERERERKREMGYPVRQDA